MAQPAYSRLQGSPSHTEFPSFVNVCYQVLSYPLQGEIDETVLARAYEKAQEILNAEDLEKAEKQWEAAAFRKFDLMKCKDGRILSIYLANNKPLDPNKKQGIPKVFLTLEWGWDAIKKLIDLMLCTKDRKFLYELLSKNSKAYSYILERSFSCNAPEILAELLKLPHFNELDAETIQKISVCAGTFAGKFPECSRLWSEKLLRSVRMQSAVVASVPVDETKDPSL